MSTVFLMNVETHHIKNHYEPLWIVDEINEIEEVNEISAFVRKTVSIELLFITVLVPSKGV